MHPCHVWLGHNKTATSTKIQVFIFQIKNLYKCYKLEVEHMDNNPCIEITDNINKHPIQNNVSR